MSTNYNPNEESSASQNDRIAEALRSGETLTALDALKRFGCFRLTSRIYDLTQRGLKIHKEWKRLSNGKKSDVLQITTGE